MEQRADSKTHERNQRHLITDPAISDSKIRRATLCRNQLHARNDYSWQILHYRSAVELKKESSPEQPFTTDWPPKRTWNDTGPRIWNRSCLTSSRATNVQARRQTGTNKEPRHLCQLTHPGRKSKKEQKEMGRYRIWWEHAKRAATTQLLHNGNESLV